MDETRAKYARRRFLGQSVAVTGAFFIGRSGWAAGSPSGKLDIAVIGVANQGAYNLQNVATENIIALCDIDEGNLRAAAAKFPQAKTYRDFRQLLDREKPDAVVVATPDHTHAVAAVRALKQKCHVYCEKPLARTIAEARVITNTARKMNRVTQIGTQIHAGKNYRRVVELVKSNAIGKVGEVHVWVRPGYGGRPRRQAPAPIPAGVDYDLWLGPVPYRPYHPDYLPFNWRHWWAFGGGTLADFGCHYLDLPHWALDLPAPLAVEAEGPPVDPENVPEWMIARYEYPGLRLTWYSGDKQPKLLTPKQASDWRSGVLFVGAKGMLLADYSKHVLLPEDEFAGFAPPAPFIPDSIGHHQEWIQACKTGGQTTCHFGYSGPLTEAALLGNVAYRSGSRVVWDAPAMRARYNRSAEPLIQYQYRKGWKL